jgi:hypothetical protein
MSPEARDTLRLSNATQIQAQTNADKQKCGPQPGGLDPVEGGGGGEVGVTGEEQGVLVVHVLELFDYEGMHVGLVAEETHEGSKVWLMDHHHQERILLHKWGPPPSIPNSPIS